MIEVRHVTKSYGNKRQQVFTALKDVSLEIPSGASVAIVGKSGSGKSTLMHAMSGLDLPQTGEILVDGKDILTLNAKAVDRFRSEQIGFVFQSFFVQANETCFYNVSLPLEIAHVPKSKRGEMVKSALEKVDLLDKKDTPARDLSGGQKQRLAIARAIVNKPHILFADEPTGNLDSTTGDRIEELLFQLNKEGVTLVIVTHDQDLADKCSMRIYIRDGEVERIDGQAGGRAKREVQK